MPALLQAHRFAYRGTVTGAHLLSPDGAKIAWVGPYWGRATLFVRDRRSGETRNYRARGTVRWTADSRRLLYVADTTGAENPHVFSIDTEAKDTGAVDLTPYPGVKATIHQMTEADPAHVLVLHNRRDRKLFDLVRINLETRAETLVAANPGNAVAPVTREDGRLQGWETSREAGRTPEEKRQPQAVRAPALRRAEDVSVRVIGPTADGQSVWALSNRGRDRVALVVRHSGLGWEKVVFEDADADVSGVAVSAVTRTPLYAMAQAGAPKVEILDPALKADLAPLLKQFAGADFGLDILSTDRSEQRLIVMLYTSTQNRVYLVDRMAKTHELLGSGVPEDMARALAPMESVKIAGRDGLRLQGYLTLPTGTARKNLPMVLQVHGGPWQRTPWADPLRAEDSTRAQFLANRGYAVLQVDYRGSTGHGRAFFNAGIGEFAGRMQDDLHDAVKWAVDQGIADPNRVAIMGLSYGGYAALVGMTATPKAFSCGVSINGPTDLATLIESFPPYWSVDLSLWHDFVGNPKVPEDRAEMTRRSPLTHAARAERPILIIQGERDVRVRPDQSTRMADALRKAGKPVRLVSIPEMGHAPSYWAHQQKVLRETELFLHGCLGGRASRFDPFDALGWVWARLPK